MIPALQEALEPKEYEQLPECVKANYSVKEWLWLSDAEKARLVQDETEPESFDQ